MSGVDKDRPSSWVKFREGLCGTCVASCCHMPLEVNRADLELLGLALADEASEKKIAKRLIREGKVRSYRAQTGLFLLQQNADSSCQFLRGGKCVVYEKRPAVCRGFPTVLGPRVGFCPFKLAP